MDPVFNRARTPSKRLATAIRQIDDWRGYERTNLSSLREDLVPWCETRNILKLPTRLCNPANYAKEILADHSTTLYVQYHVIIGMREYLTDEKRHLKDRYRRDHAIDVAEAMHRFLDTAIRYKTKRPKKPRYLSK